ncbi:MAG TPA: STAS domain-containing protein [Candidatus Baltobacteraceae bacterium]|jgi:anti-anti-sigma factor
MSDELLRVAVLPGPPVRFVLEGELDFGNAKTLVRAFDRIPDPGDTIVDLTGLAFIDSSGLTAIANYARKAMPHGRVTVVVPQAAMRRLFSITALDTILAVVDRAPE